jgi:NodT family efflux transporter outer membrane factor (OMF) lipoprotein
MVRLTFPQRVSSLLLSALMLMSPAFSAETIENTAQMAKQAAQKSEIPDKKAVSREALKARAATWRETASPADNPSDLQMRVAFPDKAWWLQFNDPLLDGYIQQAVKANLNLAITHERIEEARALARQSLGQEFPQISLGESFTRQRSSANTVRSARNTTSSSGSASGSGSSGAPSALGQALNFYTVPLVVNYEADIWHKNRDRTRAVDRQMAAVERDFQTTHVVLASDLATAYFNLLTADQLITLQKQVLATAESDLSHAEHRYEAGVTDQEDVVLRQGRLTDYKAQLQDFYQLQALSLNQLAILMAKTPYQVADLPRAHWEQYSIPAEVSAGVPSDLLTRRPDILAAEDRMAASGLLVQVARKEMLPSFNITGQFGFSSIQLKNLLNWDSYIASIGGNLLQSLFTGGQKTANLRVFKSRYEQALYSYRGAILQAFREVDDSLASLKAHRNAYAEYESSFGSLQQRLKIQENRLAAGAASDFDLAPVRLEVTLAQEGLARNKLAALTDTLSLYKALGGGY